MKRAVEFAKTPTALPNPRGHYPTPANSCIPRWPLGFALTQVDFPQGHLDLLFTVGCEAVNELLNISWGRSEVNRIVYFYHARRWADDRAL